MAIMYNIIVNKKEDLLNTDIIFTNYGKMDPDESIKQIMAGIKDYPSYRPKIINENIIIHEPNLLEQPK
jgi:hypothetical protein